MIVELDLLLSLLWTNNIPYVFELTSATPQEPHTKMYALELVCRKNA